MFHRSLFAAVQNIASQPKQKLTRYGIIGIDPKHLLSALLKAELWLYINSDNRVPVAHGCSH